MSRGRNKAKGGKKEERKKESINEGTKDRNLERK